jgi:hypothetical protein
VNVPKAFERAFAAVIRTYAELGESVTVRCWQSLADENGGWSEEKDRSMPFVDIRSSTPQFDDNERTQFCETTVLCGTKVDDDKDHAVVSALYGAVQGALDALMEQDFKHVDGDELSRFKDVLIGDLGSDFHFGGFKGFAGAPPYDDGGVSILGCGFRVDYSRADISV